MEHPVRLGGLRRERCFTGVLHFWPSARRSSTAEPISEEFGFCRAVKWVADAA